MRRLSSVRKTSPLRAEDSLILLSFDMLETVYTNTQVKEEHLRFSLHRKSLNAWNTLTIHEKSSVPHSPSKELVNLLQGHRKNTQNALEASEITYKTNF